MEHVDDITAREVALLAEPERQEQDARLAKIRAAEEARQQEVARGQSQQLAAIGRQFADATAGDAELTRKRHAIADAIRAYLEQVEERKQKLADRTEALQRLPFEVAGELQCELATRN